VSIFSDVCVGGVSCKELTNYILRPFIHGIDARTKKRLGEGYILQENDLIKIVSAK